MSAYLVSDETINVITWGLFDYGLTLAKSKAAPFANEALDETGRVLLQQNYDSLAARYGDDATPHEYHFKKPKKYDEGILLGCVRCYIYQSCETENFGESTIYNYLNELKSRMLTRMIENKGLDMPWGVA